MRPSPVIRQAERRDRRGAKTPRERENGIWTVALVAFVAFVASSAACSRSNEAAPQGASPLPVTDTKSDAEPSARVESAGATAHAETAAASSSPSSPATESRPEPARATVTLVDAGRPPRKRLRYSFLAAQKPRKPQNERLHLELRTALSQAVGEAGTPDVTLPPVSIVIAVEPQSVSSEGDLLTYAWTVVRATSSAGSSPAQIAEGMRAEVAAVEHLSGTGVIDSQGISRGVAIDPPDADASNTRVAAEGTGQMVEQVRQTLRDMAAPFPTEEVGAGARWTKLSELVSKEAVLTQSDAFTLTSLQGSTGTLDDVLAQTAPAQVLRGPGVPEGAEARMESMLASGQAKTRFDLSRLVPQMKFDGTTTMVLSGAAPREEMRRVTMSLRIGMTVTGTLE